MFFTILSIIAAAITILFVTGNIGMIASLEDDRLATFMVMSLVGIMLVASLLSAGQRLGSLLQQIVVTTALVALVWTGYEYRSELQQMASRVAAGVASGTPLSTTDEAGRQSVTITRSQRHFATRADVNGTPLKFIVDTGASSVVLTYADAGRIGFDTAGLDYVVPVMTANGMARAAPVQISEMSVGTIARTNVSALVAEEGQLFENLLGMNFLNTLSGYEVSGNRLTLRD